MIRSETRLTSNTFSIHFSATNTSRSTPAVHLLFPDQNSLYLWVYGNDHTGIWSPGHNKGLLFYETVFPPLADLPFQSVHIKSAHPGISQMLAEFAAMADLVWYPAYLCVSKIDMVGEAGHQTTWPTLAPPPPPTHTHTQTHTWEGAKPETPLTGIWKA